MRRLGATFSEPFNASIQHKALKPTLFNTTKTQNFKLTANTSFLNTQFSSSLLDMAHDTYELPSIYTRQPPEQNFADSEDEEEEIINNDGRGGIMVTSSNSALPSRHASYKDLHAEDNRLAWLLLGTAFFTLIMTVIPVVADLPNISPWFTGDALWRFFDPLITLPLNLFIITRADIMVSGRSSYCK